ncbi:MAG TPA: DUF4926 domain-containing protein [Nitrospirales bacterium]|jgi:hypothetical protein
MSTQPKLLDVVALIEDVPQHRLSRGQVGTVVEVLGQDILEVEFADNQGRTYATVSLESDQLMVLHHQPT